MGFTPGIDHRRSIQLPNWDYRENGAYFVTVCTHQRACLFEGGRFNKAIEEIWRQIPAHFAGVEADEFVVMPNHVHGIVLIVRPNPGVHHGASLLREFVPRQPVLLRGSLGAILLQFKAAATRRVNELRGTPAIPVWQRNYYERVLRDDRELDRAREYILDNPRRWAEDKYNPGVRQQP